MNNHTIKYRPEIDGLRAIAVLMVIFYHFEISFFNKEIFSGGYLGVDIFFVISGYVITSSLSKKNIDSFTGFILSFYKSRIKRLLPALITFTFIITFLFSFFSPEDWISLRTAFTSLLGFSNLFLSLAAIDLAESINIFLA